MPIRRCRDFPTWQSPVPLLPQFSECWTHDSRRSVGLCFALITSCRLAACSPRTFVVELSDYSFRIPRRMQWSRSWPDPVELFANHFPLQPQPRKLRVFQPGVPQASTIETLKTDVLYSFDKHCRLLCYPATSSISLLTPDSSAISCAHRTS